MFFDFTIEVSKVQLLELEAERYLQFVLLKRVIYMLYVFLFWKAIIFPSVPLEDFIYDKSRLILSVFIKGFLPNQRVDKEFRCT